MNLNVHPMQQEGPARSAAKSLAVYLIYTVCAAAFLIPFLRTLYMESDEGLFFCGAARILRGQVFGRDFLEIMGPGSFYWMAAFFKVLGPTFLAARLSILVPFFGTGLMILWLSRRVCLRFWVLPGLFLTGPFFGLFGQIESHHADSICFAVLTVVCLVLWKSRTRTYLLALAGVSAGITTCFLQPMGVLLLMASLLWLLIQRGSKCSFLMRTSPAVAGYLGVGVLVLAYFWHEKALSGIYYSNYYIPTHGYGPGNTVPYAQRINDVWNFFVTQPGGSKLVEGIAIIAEVPSYFIAALPGLLVLLGIGYKWKSIDQEVLLLWLCGGAVWVAEFHRCDIHHLAYGSPILTVVCFHMLGRFENSAIRVSVGILAACLLCLGALNCIASAQLRSVATRTGPVAAFGPGADKALSFLMEHSKPGEDDLVYPCAPAFYFLSATNNPTPYSALFYGQTTPAQFHEVLDILEKRHVPYVVWDTQLLAKRDSGGIMHGLRPNTPGEILIEPYLLAHYSAVAKDGDVLVLKRNSP